jgi:hypothetical protein
MRRFRRKCLSASIAIRADERAANALRLNAGFSILDTGFWILPRQQLTENG